MNKTIIILILAFISGFLVFYNPKSVSNPTQWETRTDNQAGIAVTVTPIELSAKSGEWKFDIVMDTHSVELDQDMAKVAALVDDRGKEYKPLRWEGAPAGGHHREGLLVFNQIAPTPKFVELKVSGIGGVARNFVWQLK